MFKRSIIIAMLPAAAFAQAVPALETASTPPQVAAAQSAPALPPPALSAMTARNPALSAREKESVALSKAWVSAKSSPGRGPEGAVTFEFGATLPTIVCAPLFVCDVQLQDGEIVNNINIGDAVRWNVAPASSGQGASQATHLLIKPSDSNLTTNLVVTTDRRTYVLKLLSRTSDPMWRVAFNYPEEARKQWEAFVANQRAQAAAEQARERDRQRATVLATGESIGRLDFGFQVAGDRPSWRPVRVYSDGAKTYIEFPSQMRNGDAPALVGVGVDNNPEIINYRTDGNRYVVDQVIDRAALISGVGRHQVKVDIRRTERG